MNKDQKYFIEQMYQDNHEGFLRFLMQKTRNTDDAHDVLQEAFQKLITRDGLGDMENPRAYLYRTATNIIIDRRRKGQHHKKYIREVTNGVQAGTASLAAAIPPDRQVAARQELAMLDQALNDLPEKCRRTFLLHREQYLKYSEIAEKLQISVSMVEKYMIQALKHLRRKIKRNN
ncbi:MAG: sigma-70 family RNA polymerase sigma factor [Alphaproteobacteria bacterium]|nr:sigma-70 family RNA polymerase sigma factor [Alphaproteobacteria bacterium]